MLRLEDVISFAAQAHRGQKDLSGQPYILHPLAVMSKMHTDSERIVAVLHDVIEDCPLTMADLMEKLALTDEIMCALVLITKIKEIEYWDYIKRIKPHPLARKVKIADLEHNMDLRRTIGRENMSEKDKDRIAKYYKAWSYLTGE